MQRAISIAKDKKKSVTAHVRDYNTASNHLFQKLGFNAINPGYNTLYVLENKKQLYSEFSFLIILILFQEYSQFFCGITLLSHLV